MKTKYFVTYEKIINKAKYRNLISDYFETHHIIPKSLGGNDNKENLVKLTPKEHYIVHHLLWKHYKCLGDKISTEKMSYAFWSMCIQHKEKRYITSKSYELIRIQHSKLLSLKYKGINNPNFGNGEKIKGNKNHMYGIRRSEEWKETHSKLLSSSGLFKKENNSASKEYFVINTIKNTTEFIKKGYLIDYCREHNIKYTTLYGTSKSGVPISRGNGKGIMIINAKDYIV